LDPAVVAALGAFHLPPASHEPPDFAHLLHEATTLTPSTLPAPSYAVSVDGSLQELEVRPDFPSARVGFTKVAGVLSRLESFAPPVPGHFVDPIELANATSAALVTGVVPTSVVVVRPNQSMHEAWRESVWRVFEDSLLEGPTGVTTTLTQVLAAVLGAPGGPKTSAVLDSCPGRHDNGCDATSLSVSMEGSRCAKCQTPLFFTDVTNTQDEVVPDGSNLTALGRLMSVLELLAFLWQVRIFASTDGGRILPRTAFILDGPLAVFGRPAGLKRPALRFLQAIHQEELAASRPGLPIVIGIEKSGVLADHANAIREHIPRGTLLTLPDDYIRERVQHRSGARPYGYDTDYGRRFVYRTRDGRVIVFSAPPLPFGETIDDAASVDLGHYPQLAAITAFLDAYGTLLYRDSIIPVALAHSFASYPLGTGSQVLTFLAQDSLGAPRTHAQSTIPG
jgi:hypothetical protein